MINQSTESGIDEGRKKELLKVYLEEYKLFRGKIDELTNEGARYFMFFPSGIAILLYWGLKEEFNQILFLIPPVTVALFLYIINIYERVSALDGYLSYLEEKINACVKTNALMWETTMSPVFFRLNSTIKLFMFSSISVGIIINYICVKFFVQEIHSLFTWIAYFTIVYAPFVAGMVFLVWGFKKIPQKAKELAEKTIKTQ